MIAIAAYQSNAWWTEYDLGKVKIRTDEDRNTQAEEYDMWGYLMFKRFVFLLIIIAECKEN